MFLLLLCRPDEVKEIFTKFGDIKDVYIPRDYYTKCVALFLFDSFFPPHLLLLVFDSFLSPSVVLWAQRAEGVRLRTVS